uniref:F-box domain-containing protein n=1 Tax=Brassica campestris TaxID=3711 RepID=M4ECU4_BRACM
MKKEYKTDASMGQTQGVDSKGKGKEGQSTALTLKAKDKEVSGSLMGQNQSVGEIITGPSPFDDLPEDCISNIVAFTSPRDACVSSSVSKTFESAVRSDSVWEKFLPLDYTSLAPASRAFSSKRELYFALCDHFLIDDGKKSFWLEKGSGKKCVMLAARALWITWGSSPEYWQWISMPESRFEKVAELLSVWWFEIRGKMNTRLIFLGTRYSAYIVFKTVNKCPGLADLPVEVGVGLVGQEIPKQLIYFDGYMDKDAKKERGEMRDVMKPKKREDGWMEAELGEFFNEEGCNEIELSVIEIKSPYWKCGLIIQGIEFRPTTSR